jgi:hypothetical protein
MKKLLFLLFISQYISLNGQQNSDSITYLYTKSGGVGYSNITISNNLISPLIYNGSGINLYKSIYADKNNNHLWLYNSSFSYAYLTNNINVYGVSHIYLNNNVNLLFPIKHFNTSNFQLKVGVSGHVFFDVNYKTSNTNNEYSYVCYLALGPAIHLKYSLVLFSNRIEFNNYVSLPLIGLVSSSQYAVSNPNFDKYFYSFKPASLYNNRDFNNNFYIEFSRTCKSRFSWRIGINSHISYQPFLNSNKMLNSTIYIGRIVKIYN